MIYKGVGSAAAPNVYTINNLILSGGVVRSGAGSTNVMKLAGNINVTGTGSSILADQSPYIIDSVISGTGALSFASGGTPGYSITVNGVNTYTGALTISTTQTSASTILSATSSYKFVVGASGVNNTIAGAGKVTFNGAFNIDLTGAGTTVGNSWTLVNAGTLIETYGSTFSIPNFTVNTGTLGARLWTRANAGVYYQFDEATGVLSVVNPDTDADGLADGWEDKYFGDNNGTATPAELALQDGTGDPDGDGATNEQEETAGTNPNSATSWPDTDGDGLKDAWEVTNFGNITAQGAAGDFDGDLATNLQEFLAETSPIDASNWPDSDGDGMSDAWETTFFGAGNLTKTGAVDSDGDSFTDFEEHEAHTNPNNALLSPIRSALKNRWSFNGSLTDSVGGSDAVVVDVGANEVAYNSISTPTAITMSGGARAASDYVKLGTNLMPKSTTPVTIELWAKQNAIQNWSRIFDFNSGTAEYLMMAWTRLTADASDQTEMVDAGVTGNAPDKNQPYGITDEYHIVLTLQPLAGVSGKMRVTVYSAKSTAADLGAAKGSFDTAINLVNFNDLIDGLGYSPWTGDSTASASYNEVRIWNGALFRWVREKLHDQGPDNATIVDTDNDSLPDEWELTYFSNVSAAAVLGDNDSDGANNRDEYIAGSNPNSAVSVPTDTDGDGLLDSWEIGYFTNITAQNGSGDPDNDGFTNEQEETNGTDPTSNDNDQDGLSDVWEKSYFSNWPTAGQADPIRFGGTDDPDSDGYTNEQEETGGSNPTVAASTPVDTDGDGLLDTWEITNFTNITAQNGTGDPDGDTYTNEQEETAKSNPNNNTSIPGDVNGDGITDGHLLLTGDTIGTTSFNSGLNWDNVQAPIAGSNYLVAVDGLRTPSDASNYTFAGDKLVFTTGGQFIIKGTGVITVPYLGMDGGWVANASNGNVVITLEGSIHVTRASSLLCNNAGIIVNATVAGNKDLTVSGLAGRIVTFNAASTLTGNLNLTTAGIVLGSTGSFKFTPGANGVTNAITGTGPATLNGAFNIDVTGASTNTGDNWDLITTTGALVYDPAFTVTGFTTSGTTAGTRVWTSASGAYSFDEATGVLTRLSVSNDTDSDGMTDTWETTYFGGLGQTATGDFDGDGTNNLTEFRLGLIPNNGSSSFSVTRSAAGLLTWPSATGLTFTVQRSTTLAAGSWTTITTVSGTAGTASYTDPSPPAGGKAFYKISLEP